MASQTGSIDLTASNGVKLMTEAGFENIEENYATKAELDVQADRIGMVVANNDASSSLQLTADAMTYIGNNVTIKGTDGTTTAISGGRIQANSLSIGAFDSAAQSATLNSNINVGGRNLLTGTGDWSGARYGSGSGTINGDVFDFSSHTGQSWYWCELSHPHIPFANVDGKTLTLSFDYRSDDFSDTTGEHYIWINAAASATETGSRSKYRQISTSAFDGVYVPTTEWQHGSITFDLSEALFNAGSGECNYFFIQFYNHTLNSFQLRHVKLEKGNKATDWTPAPEDLEAYADQTAYLTAKPNLAPIGSVEFSDVYDATTNPDGYWQSVVSAWFTQLDDGWIHVYKDNSSGAASATGALNSTLFRPSASPSVFAGKVYTILTEIRNNVSTGTSDSLVDFYLQQVNNNQFWGDTSGVVIDDDHVTTTTAVSLLTCGQSYVLHSYRIADTDHLTAGTPSTEMFRYNFRVAAGGILDFDFRMSVYEGIYDGPYKPYSGTQLFATQKDTSDAAKTATSYVTDINSNGITIHPSRSDYATNGGRAVINGDGLTVYLGSDDVASYGASARIGKPNSDRVTVDSINGITIYKDTNKKLQTTINGIDIYGDDNITNIASFGETTRIGRSSQGHAQISENGFDYFQGNENVFTVEAYGEQVYELGTEYGDRVTIPAGENARVSGTYDSQIVLEEPKCVYQLETGLWKEINYSSDGEESIYYNGINSSTTTDSSIETWGFNVYNNTSSPITAVIAQVFDRRPVSTRIGKNNSDRVTVDPTNGITIYKGNNKKLQTTTNGINIYQDNATSIASFGSTTRIGADNNVQVIIESDSFEIKNQLGNRFFNIEGRSSNQTIDRSPIEVCEWSDKDDVNEDSVTITDSNIIASTASNFTAPTFNIVVNEEEFNLDSSQVEFIISTNQININLTSTGVTFVQDKMTNTYDDEEGNTTVGPDFLCIFYVTYSRTVADKAILDFTGNQTIKGNGGLLTLSNNVSDTTNTLIKVKNEQTNKSVNFGIGSNGVTRGVWDETAKNWIICHDANNKVVIQGLNFGVTSTGDVKANAITMTGALTTPILKTKNPSKNGKYRTSESIYTLTPFTSYDKDGAQIGYSNIVVSTNRIYRSFAVQNLKTGKTAALYINNYDSGNMSLTYSSDMTLHATSVDPLSCMTAAISGQTAKSLTTSYANLTLGAVTTVGSDLTISGGGVKCARAGKVMLSASAYFYDFSAANVCNLRILIGTTVAAWVNDRATSDRCQLTIPSRITTVAAGDVLYMAVCNSSTAAGSVDGSRTQTWMTVQYLT